MKIKLFFSVLAMASMMVACGGGSSSGGGNGNNGLADIAVTDSEVVSMLKKAQSSGRGIKYYNYYTVATNP